LSYKFFKLLSLLIKNLSSGIQSSASQLAKMSLILKDQPRIPHRNFSQKRLKITIPKDQAIVVNEQQMQALQVEAASKLIFSKLE